jgi:urease accessory protein UreH/urease accessory protein UreF
MAATAAHLRHVATRSSPIISSAVAFSDAQQGFGHVVASVAADTTGNKKAAAAVTHLTTVAHRSPVRLIPCPSSSIHEAGAAVCYLSNYGGGVLAGDALKYEFLLHPSAKLGLLTQGSNRIYSSDTIRNRAVHENDNQKPTTSQSHSSYVLQKDSFLVVAPDPVVPFAGSQLQQTSSLHLDPSASCVFIDWISSGRHGNGEYWQHDLLQAQTRVYGNDGVVKLVDAFSLSQSLATPNWNAVASMILYGNQVDHVIERCHRLQGRLMQSYTRVRQEDALKKGNNNNNNSNSHEEISLHNLAGRSVMGITKVEESLYSVRWAAQSNEDLYRLFHYCLQPITTDFGMEFYKDRIRAAQSAPLVIHAEDDKSRKEKQEARKAQKMGNGFHDTASTLSLPANVAPSKSSWTAWILADSALPVGSFAHSAGLEAASQLGFVQNKVDLQQWLHSSTQSMVQTAAPFLIQSHQLGLQETIAYSSLLNKDWRDDWLSLNQKAHVLLVGNAPACRASLDQGKSLLRVVHKWMVDTHEPDKEDADKEHLLQMLTHLQTVVDTESHIGHVSVVFGLITSLLGLTEQEACDLFAFCVARDMVSAAVRLNLTGPLASVSLLASTQDAAHQGLQAGKQWIGSEWEGAGCSPVLEAIQPCHDRLEMRLFRT